MPLTKIFARRWLLCFLVFSGAIGVASVWARWRPAQRFEFRELSAEEFRLVTWNVGYFAPITDKNLRDVDLTRIIEVLREVSAEVVILQELRSFKQASEIAKGLGRDWHTHYVKTGNHEQVLAVLSKLFIKDVAFLRTGYPFHTNHQQRVFLQPLCSEAYGQFDRPPYCPSGISQEGVLWLI